VAREDLTAPLAGRDARPPHRTADHRVAPARPRASQHWPGQAQGRQSRTAQDPGAGSTRLGGKGRGPSGWPARGQGCLSAARVRLPTGEARVRAGFAAAASVIQARLAEQQPAWRSQPEHAVAAAVTQGAATLAQARSAAVLARRQARLRASSPEPDCPTRTDPGARARPPGAVWGRLPGAAVHVPIAASSASSPPGGGPRWLKPRMRKKVERGNNEIERQVVRGHPIRRGA